NQAVSAYDNGSRLFVANTTTAVQANNGDWLAIDNAGRIHSLRAGVWADTNEVTLLPLLVVPDHNYVQAVDKDNQAVTAYDNASRLFLPNATTAVQADNGDWLAEDNAGEIYSLRGVWN